MGILTQLSQNKKIKFESSDSDSWEYNGTVLEQYVGTDPTGNTLEVISISEEEISINWGENQSTLPESDLTFVD